MNEFLKCEGKKLADCQECNRYYSSHSLHYDRTRKNC